MLKESEKSKEQRRHSMQKIFLTGFVGRDPEERFTSGGTKITSFPLGINVPKGGEKITVWYKINCWEESCKKIIPHIKKGSCITAVGDLAPPSTYQNKKGDISIDLSINCHSLSFAVASPAKKEEKKEDPSVFDFGDI